jgi:hypothetical protein
VYWTGKSDTTEAVEFPDRRAWLERAGLPERQRRSVAGNSKPVTLWAMPAQRVSIQQ